MMAWAIEASSWSGQGLSWLRVPSPRIPLFITLGAAQREDQPVETVIKGYMAGLSKRSFQVN